MTITTLLLPLLPARPASDQASGISTSRSRKALADIRFQNYFQHERRCSVFGQEKARVPIDEFSDRMIVGPLRTLRLPEPNFFWSSLTPTERYHSFLRPHFQEEIL